MNKYNINVMDIETFTENGKLYPYCMCLKINGIISVFWRTEDIVMDFLNYISENSEENYIEIYTHNINFDGLLILDGIKDKNIFFDIFVRDHNLYWIKICNLKVSILIRCSYKLIPLSVSYLGLMIGLEKKTFPYKFVKAFNLNYVGDIPDKSYFNSVDDYNDFMVENKNFNLKKVSIDYCIRDLEIIYKILTNILPIIIKYYGSTAVIRKSFSFSSISYKIYSKKFDRLKITELKTSSFNTEYIRNAYYGGRCEVFGNPNNGEIIHYFDYKGMYAQCMKEKFPIGNPIIKRSGLSVHKPGFHTIKFKCAEYLPFLPIKFSKLLFPNGTITGTYWYEEILNAIIKGRCEILEHYSSLEFEKEDYVFHEYVEEFMSIRERGLYYNIFGKNMINGLYGSFALNDENETYVITLSESEFSTYQSKVEIISFKKIGNAYIIKISKNLKSKKILDKGDFWDLNNKKRNLAYAAVIASKARIKLNNSLDLVIKNGGRLYYTDTDSIFAGYSYNNIGKEIGDIKWSKIYQDGVFVSSKFYFLPDDNIKLKGINKNPYTFFEIKEKFYNENINFIDFDDQLSFIKNNFELFELINKKQIKIASYDKRTFSSNKKETTPIDFPDL